MTPWKGPLRDADLRALAAVLRELFVLGGVRVATPAPDHATSAEYDAVTVLQPSGDVVLKLTPSCLADPARRQRHFDEVAARLAPLAAVREILRGLARAATIVGVTLGALGALLAALRGQWLWALASLALGVLVRWIAPPLAARLLRRLIRSALVELPAVAESYGAPRSPD